MSSLQSNYIYVNNPSSTGKKYDLELSLLQKQDDQFYFNSNQWFGIAVCLNVLIVHEFLKMKSISIFLKWNANIDIYNNFIISLYVPCVYSNLKELLLSLVQDFNYIFFLNTVNRQFNRNVSHC